MESDISLSLCSDQALVKGKQCLVNFIYIIVSPLDKIFYNDVELARTGKGKSCLTQHLLHLCKRQLQSDGKCQHRRFGWLIEFIRTDLRKELPVNVCLLVALGIRHTAFVNLPQQHFPKSSHPSASAPLPRIGCCKIYRLLRTAAGQGQLQSRIPLKTPEPPSLFYPSVGMFLHIPVIYVRRDISKQFSADLICPLIKNNE